MPWLGVNGAAAPSAGNGARREARQPDAKTDAERKAVVARAGGFAEGGGEDGQPGASMLPAARAEAGSRLIGQLRGQIRHLTSVDSLRKTEC